ncbi:MAG: DUF2807 domain-containing protein [Sphingomonadales bacterium]|nr:DUF2807 domain-containing protein [Sphingomonadales bacterium]
MRILALSLLLPLAACNSGDSIDARNAIPASGSGSARTYAASDFTAVELRGPDDVDVRVGSAFSVRAEGDSSALDRLVIAREGDKLRIGRKHSWFPVSSGKIKVFVARPGISAGTLAGSGDLTIDRIDGGDFHGSLAGAGDIKIGRLAAETSALSIAGAGNITVDGGTVLGWAAASPKLPVSAMACSALSCFNSMAVSRKVVRRSAWRAPAFWHRSRPAGARPPCMKRIHRMPQEIALTGLAAAL